MSIKNYSDQLSEMFRPFRKLLIKMRDYLRTLNKNELFQLEKLLCTNEEINLTQSLADENTGQPCDDDKTNNTLTTTNVTIVTNNNESSTINKSNENFYTIKADSSNNSNKSDDWVSEDAEGADDEADDDENSESTSNYDNLVTADCATGYLVPNTNLGNLLQSNAAPLTYNIIISDNNNENVDENDQITPTDENGTNRDSGLGTEENGSLDQSPEQEQNTNILTGQYDENWENLRKIVEPSSSKSSSSHHHHHHHRHKEHKSKRKSRKHQSSSSDSTSTSSSSSASSSTASSPSSADSRDLSRRAKFK